MRPVILLLGDQLFHDLSALPQKAEIVMQEDLSLATRFRHHQHKLVFFFSAMRHRAEELRNNGRTVHYYPFDKTQPGILDRVEAHNPTSIHSFTPHDRAFRDEVRARFGKNIKEEPSPMFLTPDDFWASYAKGKRRLMGDFCQRQRRRMGILLDPEGNPEGGRWSYDEENRKRIPKGTVIPTIHWSEPDKLTEEVIALVKAEFPSHPGNAETFRWPVNRAGVLSWLDQFLKERLRDFGPYEDAISREHGTLWHSLLTPFLNSGLTTPQEVVDRVLATPAPISSKEGFIRQIIGWREFIKRIDEEYGETNADQNNFFNHTRKLAPCWWEGNTGMPPIDTAIHRLNQNGWCHHIERLMVLGAPMLMAEVDPRDAYRWFMEMFIDSAEWVMAPNVFGMSQFSDGGVFATKPYLSGSSYIRKMSDYPPGDWCDTWDGLYWRFLDKHRDFFAKNPRMSTLARGVDRLEPARRDRIFAAAEDFIARTTLPIS